jgi:DNA-binding MarR family transcriptional regulator
MGNGRPPAEISQFLPLYDVGGDAYFGYRMVLAAKLFDRRVSELLERHGELTLPQWRIVAQLGLNGSGTVKSLAEGAAVDRAEVSRAMRELARLRFVLRQENSDGGRRSPAFVLTAAGRRRYAALRRPISRFIAQLVDDVRPADLEAANRVLFAITRGCLEPVR